MDLMTSGNDDTGSKGERTSELEKSSTDERSPSNEVTKARRRRFTATYKMRIVREAEACSKPGQLGSLLRREGLYSSHLRKWRLQYADGSLAGLMPKKRGPKANPDRQLTLEVKKLRRETVRLKRKLERAELIIGYQKKVSEILGITLESPDDELNEDES